MSITGTIRKFFHWGLLLCGLMLLASPGNAQKSPEWLFHPPRDAHHLYGVGISPKYVEDSLTVIVAKQNAIASLVKQHTVTVEAKFAESGDAMGILSKGHVKEMVDSADVWQCRDAAEIVDSVRTKDYLFLLMRIGKDLSRPDGALALSSKLVKTSPKEAPDWIGDLPQREHTVYGLGISNAYTNVGDAWKTSAREARREIAMTLSAESSTLSREVITGRRTYHQELSEDITKVTLRYSVIEKRWFDPEKNLYYTLVFYNIPKPD